MTDKASIWTELKRRNVFRVGLFYLVASWLVVQAAETVLPLFGVPDGMLRGLILLLRFPCRRLPTCHTICRAGRTAVLQSGKRPLPTRT